MSMKIRLAADLQPDSIVDGKGIRTVIWTQGCSHACPECHNPSTHDFAGGELVDVEDIIKELEKLEDQDGVTFSGGDPMFQPKECAILASACHDLGLSVWAYTGFTFEQLLNLGTKDILNFLKEIDVLIDGKYDKYKKSMDLEFRGSSNQRIIDVPKSLENHSVVLYELNNKKNKNNSKKRETLYI